MLNNTKLLCDFFSELDKVPQQQHALIQPSQIQKASSSNSQNSFFMSDCTLFSPHFCVGMWKNFAYRVKTAKILFVVFLYGANLGVIS